MKNLASLLLAGAALAALAACGGPDATSTAADPKFVNAAPSFDHVSLQIDDADASPSSAEAVTTEQAATADTCHPHLFSRTHEIVARLNRHTWKMLRHVRDLIEDHPKMKSGTTHVWENVKDGVDRKFTMALSADGTTYSFELDMGAVPASGTATLTKVMAGTISTSTDATSKVSTTSGSFSFDYDALHAAIPTEKATGQMAFTVKVVKDPSKPAPGVQKTINISFTNFLPEEGDPHGPRTGSYAHVGEPGIGGSLVFADSLILLCPSNPSGQVANTQTVARWYKTAAGGVDGRADAKASGGQIPTGDTWQGVSCRSGTPGTATTQATENGYWMMKLENGSGVTIQGSSTESTSGTTPCDAAFGNVPSLTNNATDYDFSAAVSFPHQW